jgi:hypothetical protein
MAELPILCAQPVERKRNALRAFQPVVPLMAAGIVWLAVSARMTQIYPQWLALTRFDRSPCRQCLQSRSRVAASSEWSGLQRGYASPV